MLICDHRLYAVFIRQSSCRQRKNVFFGLMIVVESQDETSSRR